MPKPPITTTVKNSFPCYLGIDPGKTGGLAWIVPQVGVQLMQMPDSRKDLWVEISRRYRVTHCYVEHVTTSPQMGVKSAGTFMQGKGEILMALTAAEIPYEEVRPLKWQKALGIPGRKKTETTPQWKNRLKAKAQELYPSEYVTKATCDALLIAEYLRRVKEGELT